MFDHLTVIKQITDVKEIPFSLDTVEKRIIKKIEIIRSLRVSKNIQNSVFII